MNDAIKKVRKMLAVGTPLIAVDSYDHPATLQDLQAMLAGKDRPIVVWNACDGFRHANDFGQQALQSVDPAELKEAKKGPHIAITLAAKFPAGTVCIVDNLHWFWDKPQVMQAMLNVRDLFKASKRAVIGLTLDAKIPTDLQQSVCWVNDPLPSEDVLEETVRTAYQETYGEELSTEEAIQCARELRGNAAFKSEQLAYQSFTTSGLDRNKLRDHCRKTINDTPGLHVETGDEDFSDIGGLQGIVEYLGKFMNGPRKATLVIRVEEIEKAIGGAGTDTSGTSGDALGTFLTAMEDNQWTGILAHGIPGCGKSLVAKATANEFGAKAIRFDINACKGSLVGESEKQIRQAMDVLKAIGGERVFFIASMNKIKDLPPELQARFSAGTWFFDVPDAEGRKQIWQICSEQFGVKHDGYDAANLTGRDIRNICQRAYELGCSTTEAAAYVVPLCKAAPDAIGDTRKEASCRYLDATNGGVYQDQSTAAGQYDASRAIDLED